MSFSGMQCTGKLKYLGWLDVLTDEVGPSGGSDG